uniref:C-type lectin domain-containing protein n=1 Tax=Acrobeloides nanus TaxID=290746 RepID=A0A914ENZ7_9BILA
MVFLCEFNQITTSLPNTCPPPATTFPTTPCPICPTCPTFKAPCPENWIYWPERQKCYNYKTENANFAQALSGCQQENASLISIHDLQENLFVSSLTVDPKYDTWIIEVIWIGLNDPSKNGNWQWVDGSPVDYTIWQPNNPGNGSCVILASGSRYESLNNGIANKWQTADCGTEIWYICEKNALV